MKNVRSFISSYAEGYLILVTLLCGYSPSLSMPPLFVGLVASILMLAKYLSKGERVTV